MPELHRPLGMSLFSKCFILSSVIDADMVAPIRICSIMRQRHP